MLSNFRSRGVHEIGSSAFMFIINFVRRSSRFYVISSSHEQNFLVHKSTRAIPSLEIRYKTVQIRDLMKTERMKIPVSIKINWRFKQSSCAIPFALRPFFLFRFLNLSAILCVNRVDYIQG